MQLPALIQASLMGKCIIGSHFFTPADIDITLFTVSYQNTHEQPQIFLHGQNFRDFPISLDKSSFHTINKERLSVFTRPLLSGRVESHVARLTSTILELCASTGGNSGQSHYHRVKGEKTLRVERRRDQNCQGLA